MHHRIDIKTKENRKNKKKIIEKEFRVGLIFTSRQDLLHNR